MDEKYDDNDDIQIDDEKVQQAIQPASSLFLEILIFVDIFYTVFFYIVLIFLFIFKNAVFDYSKGRIFLDVFVSIIFAVISFIRFRISKIFFLI
jgi:hypothetical protein